MRTFFYSILHVFILSTVAYSYPILNLLSSNDTFFVAHRAGAVDLVVFSLFLTLFVPILYVILVAPIYVFSHRWFSYFQLLPIGVFAMVFTLQVFSNVSFLPGFLVFLLAGFSGIIFAFFYFKTAGVKIFLAVLSPGIAIALIAFFFSENIQQFYRPQVFEAPSTSSVSRVGRPPVVFLLFDELPMTTLIDEKGEINSTFFPNFSALSKESRWYRNATTVADYTQRAVTAILTGRYKKGRASANYANFPKNLFTAFGREYSLSVHEPVTALCPLALCPKPFKFRKSIPRWISMVVDAQIVFLHVLKLNRYSALIPRINKNWGNFVKIGALKKLVVEAIWGEKKAWSFSYAERRDSPVFALRRELELGETSEKPKFYFLHLLLPHGPYGFYPSGKHYGWPSLNGVVLEDNRWRYMGASLPLVKLGFQRHFLQAMYADHLLGLVVESLKQAGLYREALLVLTSDHGVNYQPEELIRRFSYANLNNILRVPIFIKRPRQSRGVMDDRAVETIDVLPTVMRETGIVRPWEMDGAPLFGNAAGEKKHRTLVAGADRAVYKLPLNLEPLEPQLRNHLGNLKTRDGIYALGGFPDLIGKRIRDSKIEKIAGMTAEVYEEEKFRSVAPRRRIIDGYVRGRLATSQPAGKEVVVAVAVNGKIQATTTTYSQKGEPFLFDVIVPPSAFKRGRNKVEIFRVRARDKAGPILGRLTPVEYQNLIISEGGAEFLSRSNGSRVPIEHRKGIKGAVRSVEVKRNLVSIEGWVVDLESKKPPPLVVFYLDKKLLGTVVPSRFSKRISERFRTGDFRYSGFFGKFPFKKKHTPDPQENIAAFAISEEGIATPLEVKAPEK